ncbi:ABC transporter ATP-binding protein [Thermoflavimicrobium daqui]|uniref:Bacitracin ABC transporter ATP-binding protein n=1 Tax=Thermoflavimicrobium daqui TaxID=2137476 RepID=A0A364K501_9BACL|nr:ABC transporter ATP-binding protein [Thermoflavimicrobium daqui]RAL24426.1 bacitracin ABC transporter ATP-binding protein [Thermoflavimicrobium daqui]
MSIKTKNTTKKASSKVSSKKKGKNSTPALKIINLKKEVKGKLLVKGLDFEIKRGEVFGFLGPNGAGKTTTIRMLVGLTNISEGDVFICGHSIKKEFEKAIAHVGSIVENPDLYKFLTGYQNLKHFARMNDVDKKRIDEVVELVDLKHAIHSKVKTYSLGMRQRLGLAQALLHRPSLLILDEPTNGLDPAGIHELRNHLRKLAHEENLAVLVSSHLLTEMELMCDRVAIIQKGELIQIQNVKDFTSSDDEEREVTFEIKPIDVAIRLLQEHFPDKEFVTDNNKLTLMIKHQEIPKINALLVTYGIHVYNIQQNTKSLEEKFLEVTEK